MTRRKQPKGFDGPIIGSKSPQRYKICADDSGHDYYIPVEQVDEFYEWVRSFEDEDHQESYSGREFDNNRIDGTFTFTDPQCN